MRLRRKGWHTERKFSAFAGGTLGAAAGGGVVVVVVPETVGGPHEGDGALFFLGTLAVGLGGDVGDERGEEEERGELHCCFGSWVEK